MTVRWPILGTGAAAAALALVVGGGQARAAGAYFAAEQASAGKTVFEAHCSSCHSVKPNRPSPVGLNGSTFVSRWHSANDLHQKIANTMPANLLLSLSKAQYANVTAYLLSVNGTAAGSRRFDPTAAKPGNTQLPRPTVATAPSDGNGFYTVAQAVRGKGYFAGSCAACHSASPAPGDDGTSKDPFFATVTLDPSAGFVVGDLRMRLHLAGPSFIAKWPSVGALLHRIESTMPGSYAGHLDRQTYLDITAYLLSANGLPPGKNELRDAPQTNDAMSILEKGFTSLFDGKDFQNFRFLRGQGCGLPPEGCGDVRPGDTFTIKDRVIANSGTPYGVMYTKGKFLNFDLRLDYRYPPEKDSSRIFHGNSGYLLFVEKPMIWPKSIEIEGQEIYQLAILPLDTTAEFTWNADAFNRARKPLGMWSSVRILSQNGVVKSYLNDVLVSEVKHRFTQPGHIMFQAEGAPIFWRNIRMHSFDATTATRE